MWPNEAAEHLSLGPVISVSAPSRSLQKTPSHFNAIGLQILAFFPLSVAFRALDILLNWNAT